VREKQYPVLAITNPLKQQAVPIILMQEVISPLMLQSILT
jgi:hypothetical protein